MRPRVFRSGYLSDLGGFSSSSSSDSDSDDEPTKDSDIEIIAKSATDTVSADALSATSKATPSTSKTSSATPKGKSNTKKKTKGSNTSDPHRQTPGVPVAAHVSSAKPKSFNSVVQTFIQNSTQSLEAQQLQQNERLELIKRKLVQDAELAKVAREQNEAQQTSSLALQILASKDLDDDDELKKDARAALKRILAKK